MATQIFVNLPVADLSRAMSFYEVIGFQINRQFTDETAACIVISETIHVMLLTHEKFSQFTAKQIADTSKTAQMLVCLSRDSRDGVDAMMAAALAAGATEPRPMMDYGFMVHRSFEDPDGHIWEVMWMDPVAVQPA